MGGDGERSRSTSSCRQGGGVGGGHRSAELAAGYGSVARGLLAWPGFRLDLARGRVPSSDVEPARHPACRA